jgi:hypothetical protein
VIQLLLMALGAADRVMVPAQTAISFVSTPYSECAVWEPE